MRRRQHFTPLTSLKQPKTIFLNFLERPMADDWLCVNV
jgi:hypothetical protein